MARSLITTCTICVLALLASWLCSGEEALDDPASDALWREAARRADVFEECGRSARRLIQGWLDFRLDAATGLISCKPVWEYHNEAADHYSSLVLAAHYVRPELNETGGALHRTLKAIEKYCLMPNGIPALYDLKSGAKREMADFGHLSEWLRDGLIRIVENKGVDNDWYRELERLVDAMLKEAEKRGGMVQAFPGPEPVGNMLQTLARLYALSGHDRYILAAEELADAYLLDPNRRIEQVKFIDHGCENVPGFGELFALECKLKRPKAKAYREPMMELLDRILAAGAHPETGLFCTRRQEKDGSFRWDRPPDTWGYVLFTFENYDHGTGEGRYCEAIKRPLTWLLDHRRHYLFHRADLWPSSRTRDNWSDSYESFIILWKRYPEIGDGSVWLDWATLRSAHRRFADQDYGPYHGDHFDGSTSRALCTHMMFQSRGVRPVSFREGLRLGGIEKDGALCLMLKSDDPWRGKLCFEGPRGIGRAATLDWARINEMPAWYVIQPRKKYIVRINGREQEEMWGEALISGYKIEVEPGESFTIRVKPAETEESR